MSTRCSITIKSGEKGYRIYRHHDGYPEGVLSDLKLFSDNYGRGPRDDPEYFLATFIFYAKLSDYLYTEYPKQKPWETGYGVCSLDCQHGDLDYEYTFENGEWHVCPKHPEHGEPKTSGSLEDLIKHYGYSPSCHINPAVFDRELERK